LRCVRCKWGRTPRPPGRSGPIDHQGAPSGRWRRGSPFAGVPAPPPSHAARVRPRRRTSLSISHACNPSIRSIARCSSGVTVPPALASARSYSCSHGGISRRGARAWVERARAAVGPARSRPHSRRPAGELGAHLHRTRGVVVARQHGLQHRHAGARAGAAAAARAARLFSALAAWSAATAVVLIQRHEHVGLSAFGRGEDEGPARLRAWQRHGCLLPSRQPGPRTPPPARADALSLELSGTAATTLELAHDGELRCGNSRMRAPLGRAAPEGGTRCARPCCG
jgi:hypothetical protein